jgi:poly(3-hydroxybutyrate) depolymerase
MSVRATDRLIGDIVGVTGLSNSAKMVVQTVDADAKMVTAIWFSDAHEVQVGTFPASSLDRVEVSAPAKTGKNSAAAGRKTAKKR